MGPKKGKEAGGEDFWRKCIELAPLNDLSWEVKVIIIEAAGSDQDRIYLGKFEAFAEEERRFVIKNISKTETLFMINQLGGEKKVKDDSMRVFEEGQVFLKDKLDVPSDLLALTIKHLILKMKEEYLFIQRQRLQVREGLRRESATMVDRAEVKGAISVKPPLSPEPVKPTKGKKGEGDASALNTEPDEGKKYNTELRERGEEWRDKVYIDDFPIDGPNLYVAVTGFQDPHLAGCLVKIGVPLTAVVQIRIETANVRVPSSLSRPSKRGQSQTDLLMTKSLLFWESVQQLRIHEDTAEDLKNVAFIIFSPPYWEDSKLSGSPDKIYDELCFLMYDVQDLCRQHLNYLLNMDVIEIPQDDYDEYSTSKYFQFIEFLPFESVTTFSVLDSILQAVCKKNDGEASLSTSMSSALPTNTENKNKLINEKSSKAQNLVKETFKRLIDFDNEINKKKYRPTYGEELENYKDPIIINFGDFSKNSTFHLGNINLDHIVYTMLLAMPLHKLWQNLYKAKNEMEAKINYHVSVLVSCFERNDIETSELNRLLQILACRKLYNNRSSSQKHHVPQSTTAEFKKVYLKRSILAEPLPKCPSQFFSSCTITPSFPSMTKIEEEQLHQYTSEIDAEKIQYLFDCPDISELISAAEITSNQPIIHMIDDFDYFEDFRGISSFQMMQDVFNKYNCVDYKYCEVTDSIVLMFFNSHDKDGVAREEWRCHLPTPVSLQDFFDFVYEENYDWIANQERIYEDKLEFKKQSECKEFEIFATRSCIDATETGNDLLMEGSLKHQEFVTNLENDFPDTQEIKLASKSKVTAPSTSESDKTGNKSKTPPASTLKSTRQSITMSSPNAIKLFTKPFTGFDLGDRRVEILGKNLIFFSKDGTRIFTDYYIVIPTNVEFVTLNIVPGNSYNEIRVHRALGDFIDPELIDVCESFRITCKDDVLVNIKKQTYEVPIPRISTDFPDEPKGKDNTSLTNQNSKSSYVEMFETKFYHRLYITWPNGLIIESVHVDNSPEIAHIKQHYLIPPSNLNENMRCMSRVGEVIIFKTNGYVEVLQPDGTYILITKCEKRIVVPVDAENSISPSSASGSDKSKRNKGKPEKPKKDKSSQRSSKSQLTDDSAKEKPPEYELYIEEYEIIETSGLKQKYTNGIFIDIEKFLIRTATDYNIQEIFSRRMDGTNILLNKDGIQVVTFKDTTRIITSFIVEENEIYPEWTDEEREYFDILIYEPTENEISRKGSASQKSYFSTTSSFSRKIEEESEELIPYDDGYVSVLISYTMEHPNFATVHINGETGAITISSPNNTSVSVDDTLHYNIELDDITRVKFNGKRLHVDYEACKQCSSRTYCDVTICKEENEETTTNLWLKLKDSYNKQITIDKEGGLTVIEDDLDEELVRCEETQNDNSVAQSEKTDASFVFHGKCRVANFPRHLRFFILRRDLSCSELVHRSFVEDYKTSCRWQPWCSINDYEAFGDHRRILSILSPIHLNESEKWLMDSKLANKPHYLSYKDLRQDEGKGFYHWMRPYDRFVPQPKKPANVLPPRLPRAFVLRTLEQQWIEATRETMKGGKELLQAILKYRQVMEADCVDILKLPILDPRSDIERIRDTKVQEFAHRLYTELKTKLEDDVQSRIKLGITTKPAILPDEVSFGLSQEEESIDEMKLQEEREAQVNELEEIQPMSPNLRRYWRVRAEETREEQFYKYLLRQGNVPPYFRNVLGGAIWWEVMNAAGDAVDIAEHVTECVCVVEEASVERITPKNSKSSKSSKSKFS